MEDNEFINEVKNLENLCLLLSRSKLTLMFVENSLIILARTFIGYAEIFGMVTLLSLYVKQHPMNSNETLFYEFAYLTLIISFRKRSSILSTHSLFVFPPS